MTLLFLVIVHHDLLNECIRYLLKIEKSVKKFSQTNILKPKYELSDLTRIFGFS